MLDNSNPRVSIITINLNNLKGLVLTANSVIENKDGYVEYIVIDGGSIDGSKEYLLQNEYLFDYWISEPDKGIYDAMNKGLNFATGNYILFLNSGDLLIDNNLSVFLQSKFHLFQGNELIYFNIISNKHGDTNLIKFPPKLNVLSFFKSGYLPHCATLINRSLFLNNLYSLKYKIASDWHFFAIQLFVKNVKYSHIDLVLSQFDLNGVSANPSNAQTIYDELIEIKNEVINRMPLVSRYFYKSYFFISKIRNFILHFILKFSKL
jgi:glycosyltransferase involved in cell wall biosynthesis